MEKLDILLWIMGGGFALMIIMWNNITNCIREVKNDLSKRMDTQGEKIEEINSKVSELDKRLYGIETVLHMKECCVLQQDQRMKKAE